MRYVLFVDKNWLFASIGVVSSVPNCVKGSGKAIKFGHVLICYIAIHMPNCLLYITVSDKAFFLHFQANNDLKCSSLHLVLAWEKLMFLLSQTANVQPTLIELKPVSKVVKTNENETLQYLWVSFCFYFEKGGFLK